MKVAHLLPLVPALLLVAACTENEEEVTVRGDGTVSVRLVTRGDAADVADGYLLPLDGPWTPDNAAARTWITLLGPSTGSAPVRAALLALPDSAPLFEPGKERSVELAVRAEFPNVAALPATYASASDPYREAFLQRATTLDVRRVDGRMVYVFERRYAPRAWERYDVLERLHLPAALEERVRDNQIADPAERAQVVEEAVRAFRETLAAFAEDALSDLYLRGPADLAPEGRARALQRVAAAVERATSTERLRTLLDLVMPPPGQPKVADADEQVAGFERGLRDTLRATLAESLAAEGRPERSAAAVLAALERLFTAYDHSADLGDDQFELTVHLPGRIVFASPAGHVRAVEDGAARFEVKGTDLHDREVVLRAVSVLE